MVAVDDDFFGSSVVEVWWEINFDDVELNSDAAVEVIIFDDSVVDSESVDNI